MTTSMETARIGIRNLKAHLSACLKRAARGEHLTITDRGRPIAVLSPAQTSPPLAWARALVAEGRGHWSGGKPRGCVPRIRSTGRPTSRMVIEDRR